MWSWVGKFTVIYELCRFPECVDLSWKFHLYRPKSAPSSQPSANGVQTEGLDYDRLKQVGAWGQRSSVCTCSFLKASRVHVSDRL